MIKDAEEKFEKKETTDKQKYILSYKLETLKKIRIIKLFISLIFYILLF